MTINLSELEFTWGGEIAIIKEEVPLFWFFPNYEDNDDELYNFS